MHLGNAKLASKLQPSRWRRTAAGMDTQKEAIMKAGMCRIPGLNTEQWHIS